MERERRFLTTGEIAKHCQVSHLTVSNWIRAGKLGASRTPGGHYRVGREDFLRFLLEYKFPLPGQFEEDGRRVLVVDDDRPLAETIAQTLHEEGYQVSVAFDGYEAGVKMVTLKPDLLILDLIIPWMDGFAVCQRVKADPEVKQTKILAMTRFVQVGNVAKAVECGADLCLEKPFRMQTLKAAAAKLLGWRRHEVDLRLGMERRRSQRVPAALPVLWTALAVGGQAGRGPQHGESLDVSREGMRLAVGAPLTPFSLVALQIFAREGQEPIQALGEARWMRERPGGQEQEAGIALIAMQDRERARLVEEIYAA